MGALSPRAAGSPGAPLDGRIALVTGGASGIGLATVRRLQEEGARVAIMDLQQPPPGAGELYLEEDVGDPTSWPGAVARIVDRMGGLDVVHLNAGVTTGESDLEQLTDERYRRLLRVNVDGVVFGARAVLPVLRQRGGGDVVATASIAGVVPMPVDPLYSMTKHAVVGLVRSLGPVYEGQNIRINAVCPGITDTPMVDRERTRLEEAGFPLIQPSEIAEAVMRAVTSGVGGQCWVVQPGRAPEPYRFRGIFGPAVAGAEGMAPPL